MGYFIDPQGNYPRHAGDVQLEVPDWNEDTDALPEGWVVVAPGTIPEIPEGYRLIEVAPKQSRGKWTRQFELEEIPVEEVPPVGE